MPTPEPTTEALIARWRERADDLDRRAKLIRADGDPEYANQREPEGWFGPGGSRRFHYFDSDLRALCGKWMLWKHPEDIGMEWGLAQDWNCDGDCAECKRRLAKREEAKAKSG